MVYTNNWLDIANRALVKIGNQQLESLVGGTDDVRIINTLLAPSIEYVAGLYNWSCMTERVKLSPEDVTPDFGYQYSYPIPNNFISLVKVETENETEWVWEKGGILTDSPFCHLVYMCVPEEPTKLTPNVRELIVLRLAYNIVESTTSNTSLLQILSQELGTTYSMALATENSGKTDKIDFNGWNEQR